MSIIHHTGLIFYFICNYGTKNVLYIYMYRQLTRLIQTLCSAMNVIENFSIQDTRHFWNKCTKGREPTYFLFKLSLIFKIISISILSIHLYSKPDERYILILLMCLYNLCSYFHSLPIHCTFIKDLNQIGRFSTNLGSIIKLLQLVWLLNHNGMWLIVTILWCIR